MTILEKARKEAKEQGRKVSPEIAKALEKVELLYKLSKKVKGSPSTSYIKTN